VEKSGNKLKLIFSRKKVLKLIISWKMISVCQKMCHKLWDLINFTVIVY
jgi:hypothetical protein